MAIGLVFELFKFNELGELANSLHVIKLHGLLHLFLVDDFCRLPFQSLKSNKINFSLGQRVVQKKCHWMRKSPFRITLQKLAHFSFSMQNCIH